MKTARSPSKAQSFPGPSWQWNSWANHSSRPTAFARLLRVAKRRKRLLAALLLCLAAALRVQLLTPSAAATDQVLLASRDLPAGHTLGRADVVPAAVAHAMVPDGAFSPDLAGPPSPSKTTGLPQERPQAPAQYPAQTLTQDSRQSVWQGRQLSGPVRRGEVLTDASLLGNELLIGSPPGTAAVPLRVSDPSTLALLSQGQLVTVVLSRSEALDGPVRNEVLAAAVPVLWIPDSAPANTLLATQNVEGLVVVAASADQALQLAGASGYGKVFLIIVPQDAPTPVLKMPIKEPSKGRG